MYPTQNSVDADAVDDTLVVDESGEIVPARLHRDTGVTTVEVLSWSAMLVVAIVLIAGLLQTLGVEVINYVRAQIGL